MSTHTGADCFPGTNVAENEFSTPRNRNYLVKNKGLMVVFSGFCGVVSTKVLPRGKFACKSFINQRFVGTIVSLPFCNR
jgi:hypothetical protein